MGKVKGYETISSFNNFWLMDFMPKFLFQLYDLFGYDETIYTKSKCFTNFEVCIGDTVICEAMTNFGDYRKDEYTGDGLLIRSSRKDVVELGSDLLRDY
tara:strand:- start:56 stop:352 length:297 start_codon:yes stop_codon:yes gene_type:complete